MQSIFHKSKSSKKHLLYRTFDRYEENVTYKSEISRCRKKFSIENLETSAPRRVQPIVSSSINQQGTGEAVSCARVVHVCVGFSLSGMFRFACISVGRGSQQLIDLFFGFRQQRGIETWGWGSWKVGGEETKTEGFVAQPTGTTAVPGWFYFARKLYN